MTTIGRFKEELCATWKNLFPLTQASGRNEKLVLDQPAGGTTPNPWWKFIMDMPLISKKDVEELNRLRRPLVVPHWTNPTG